MKDMTKLMGRICDELDKITEKGLTPGNLESTYKLIDMYKDLKNTEYWEQKGEYYATVQDEMQGGYSRDGGYSMNADGYSGRRHRDSMGRFSRDDGRMDSSYDQGSSYRRGYPRDRVRYSRNDGANIGDTYDRYMDQKQSYRSTKSPECKQRLMDALDEHMDKFTQQMEELLRDSDCAEERTTIRHYLDKLKNMA